MPGRSKSSSAKSSNSTRGRNASSRAGKDSAAKRQSRANPLKRGGRSKETTAREAASAPTYSQAHEPRRDADALAERAGSIKGRTAGGSGAAAETDAPTAHPSRHGGVTPLNERRGRMQTSAGRPGVKKQGPSPADKPRSARTGTLPHENASSGRTGRTKGDRQLGID